MSKILRKFFLPIVLPSAINAIIQQALLVVLPLYILQIEGSLAGSAMVVGLKGLGMMAADIPAGMLLSRIGDKRLMQTSAVLFIVSIVLMASVPSLSVVMLAAVLLGFSHGAWLVARISYIADNAEVGERGRIMSLSAGTIRMGAMIGPVTAGALIAVAGYATTLYLLAASGLFVLLFVSRWVKYSSPTAHNESHISDLKFALKDNQQVFLTAGVASVALMLVRSSRALLLPLIGAALLLDEASIGLAISVGAVIDTLLFYPAGSLMDRIGRKPIFIVSLSVLGLGIFMLPVAQGFISFMLIAIFMGLGNGISSGVIMTVGSDLAPKENRGSFIGVWRLLSDIGTTSGPFLIGGAIQLISLPMAAHMVGVLGMAGAVFVLNRVEETHSK